MSFFIAIVALGIALLSAAMIAPSAAMCAASGSTPSRWRRAR